MSIWKLSEVAALFKGPRTRTSGAVWIVGGQVGLVVLGWAALRVTTELLSATQYGYLALGLAGLGLVKGVLLAPLLTAQLRYKSDARSGSTADQFDAAIMRLLLTALVGAVSLLALASLIFSAPISGFTLLPVVTLGGFWLLANVLRDLCLNELNVVERHREFSLFRLAEAVFRPMLGLLACLFFARSGIVFLGGAATGILIVAGFLVAEIARLGLLRLPPASFFLSDTARDWRRQIMNLALPLLPLAATSWVIHLADRFLLEMFHSPEQVGLYSAYYALASQPFIMLSGIATLLFRPRLFESAKHQSQRAKQIHQEWMKFLVVAGGLGLVALWLFREPVATVLLSATFRRDTWIVAPLGAGYLLLAFGQAQENWLLAHLCSREVLKGGLIAATVSLFSALLFIPRWAAAGAAWSTLAGLGSYWIALLWLGQRTSGRQTIQDKEI